MRSSKNRHIKPVLLLVFTLVFAAGCISNTPNNQTIDDEGAVFNQTIDDGGVVYGVSDIQVIGYRMAAIELVNSDGMIVNVQAELADTPGKQQTGLMGRSSLGDHEGMLFVFADEQQRSFWMKNTLIPLDILFISSDRRIVEIKESFEPCNSEPCPSYMSKSPAKYVLEVNGGFSNENGIAVDSVINLPNLE